MSKSHILILSALVSIMFVNQASALDEVTKKANASCVHDNQTFRCVKFIKNYDGDTITVAIDDIHPLLGQNISVRVMGIDTAEIKGKTSCEKNAAREVQKVVESILRSAKRIDLNNVQRGKYFRIVADVIVDGISLTDILTARGLAVAYDGGTKSKVDWCKMKQRLPASKEAMP